MSPGTAGRSLRRWAPRIALALSSLLAAELAVRLFLLVRGAPQGSAAVAGELRTVLGHFGDNLTARLLEQEPGLDPIREAEHRIPHPYHGWETLEGLQTLEEDYALLPAGRPDAYEVWIVGGSVAYLFAKSEGLQRLSRVLQADPRFAHRSVVIRNYARTEFKQPQQATLVCYLLSLGLAPDALIDLDGYNEAGLALTNVALGAHPVYPSIVGWSAQVPPPAADRELDRLKAELAGLRERGRRIGEAVLRWRLDRSALVSRSALLYVRSCQRRWSDLVAEYADWVRRRRDEPALRGPHLEDGGPEAVLEAALTNFVESSRTLKSLCAARGAAYLHVLQPTLHDEGSKPFSAEERALPPLRPSSREAILKAYPRMRAAGERLRAEGIAFEDATDVFRGVEETLYFDAIHFGQRGNVLLGERIARAFLASLPPQ